MGRALREGGAPVFWTVNGTQIKAREYARFVFPVALEHGVTMAVGILLSALMGGVSRSALAAASVPNQVINVYNALFSLLTSGAAVITSRLLGAGDRREAGRTIEGSMLMAVAASVAMALLSLLLAEPFMRLLMPSAEAELLNESVVYFRVLILSFPFLAVYNVLSSVMRAADNSRSPMLAAFAMNAVQVAAIMALMRGLRMGMTGAALSYLLCRMAGAGLLFFICLKEHERFRVTVKGMATPRKEILKRILRVGLPTSVESGFVQMGYLVANMLVIGLGTWRATVFNISNSLLGMASMPSAISTATVTTFVGHQLGAGDKPGAKRSALRILAVGFAVSMTLSFSIAALGVPLSGLYTDDMETARESARMLWILIGYNICSISINTLDPALRVGGDVKYVMWQTTLCVWLIRIPLSWLMAYRMDMGVAGILWANILSLAVRMAAGWIRFAKGKWMNMRV